MTYYLLTVMSDDVRESVNNWLSSHGFDPAEIASEPIEISGGKLTVAQFVKSDESWFSHTDRDPQAFWIPETFSIPHAGHYHESESPYNDPGHWIREYITVPLSFPPPPELDQYIVADRESGRRRRLEA